MRAPSQNASLQQLVAQKQTLPQHVQIPQPHHTCMEECDKTLPVGSDFDELPKRVRIPIYDNFKLLLYSNTYTKIL